jgi:hypothetical protein
MADLTLLNSNDNSKKQAASVAALHIRHTLFENHN